MLSLPIQGVDFQLGNDLAGDRAKVTPVVVDSPVAEPETEALWKKFPGIFSDCVVTQSQARGAKLDLEMLMRVTDTGVPLAETLFQGFEF